MPSPLSNKQKFILSDLARQAWSRQSEGFRREIDEDHFRHLAVLEAVGKSGLRTCTQADYKTVEAHFLKLLGREAEAFNAHVRDAGNGRRVAWHKLRQACTLAGVTLNYAASICRTKYKCKLDDASEAQLWKLKYDLDRAIKRKKESEQEEEPHPF